MKYLSILFFSFVVLLSIGCGGDSEPEASEQEILLHYDGDNASAPQVSRGVNVFAQRFPSSITEPAGAVGGELTKVNVFLYSNSGVNTLRVYSDNSGEPGDIIREQSLSGMDEFSWNEITLEDPYPITGSDFWVAIVVESEFDALSTVGCDAGPADFNGDWLFQTVLRDVGFERYEVLTQNRESVNWNIRLVVDVAE